MKFSHSERKMIIVSLGKDICLSFYSSSPLTQILWLNSLPKPLISGKFAPKIFRKQWNQMKVLSHHSSTTTGERNPWFNPPTETSCADNIHHRAACLTCPFPPFVPLRLHTDSSASLYKGENPRHSDGYKSTQFKELEGTVYL